MERIAVSKRGYKWVPELDWYYVKDCYYYNAHGQRRRTETFRTDNGSLVYEPVRAAQMHPGTQYRTLYEAICYGDSLLWQESYHKETVKITESFTSVLGTDSIQTLDLKVHERLASFDITDLSGQEEICEGETITYSVPENNEVIYTWFSNQGVIESGQRNDTLELQWTDSYNPRLLCWAENTRGCVSDTASLLVMINICDRVDELPASLITIYPVPVQNRLWIQSEIEFDWVEVINIKGVHVLSTASAFAGLDFTLLPEGIYLVQVFNNNQLVGSKRVVKQ